VKTSKDFWRAQVEAVYRLRNPYKLERVPALLEKYSGREVELYRKLCRQYDLNPKVFYTQVDPSAVEAFDEGQGLFARFIGAASRTLARLRCASAHGRRAAGATPALSPPRAKRGSLTQATRALSPLGAQFTPAPRRRGDSDLDPVAEDLARAAEAACSAQEPPAPVKLPASWGEVPLAELVGSEALRLVTSDYDFWFAQLDAIYRRRNPYKLERVPEFLEKYRGREVLLYRKVCHQYDLDPTRFYADPNSWSDEGMEGQGEDETQSGEGETHTDQVKLPPVAASLGEVVAEFGNCHRRASHNGGDGHSDPGLRLSGGGFGPRGSKSAFDMIAPAEGSVMDAIKERTQRPSAPVLPQRSGLITSCATAPSAPTRNTLERAPPRTPPLAEGDERHEGPLKRKRSCTARGEASPQLHGVEGRRTYGRVATLAASWEARSAKVAKIEHPLPGQRG